MVVDAEPVPRRGELRPRPVAGRPVRRRGEGSRALCRTNENGRASDDNRAAGRLASTRAAMLRTLFDLRRDCVAKVRAVHDTLAPGRAARLL
jgi:hypothetical protein